MAALLAFTTLAMATGSMPPSAPLSVTLTSPRTTLLPCEPFVLQVEIVNAGSTRLDLLPIESLGTEGMLNPYVTAPDGSRLAYRTPVLKDSFAPSSWWTLEPGDVQVFEDAMLWSGGPVSGYAFPAPGEYTVDGTYRPGIKKSDGRPDGSIPPLALSALAVHVVPPDKQATAALEIWKRVLEDQFYQMDHIEWAPDTEALCTTYGNTPYGLYARFYMAAKDKVRKRLLQGSKGSPTLEALREMDRESAEEYAAILRDAPDFPLADECFLNEADARLNSIGDEPSLAVRKDQCDQALNALNTLVQRYPHSPVKEKAEKLRETAEAQLARIQAEQAAAAAQPPPEPPQPAP